MAGIVTIINHATVLIQLDGVNILTDPDLFKDGFIPFSPPAGGPGSRWTTPAHQPLCSFPIATMTT